MLASRCADLDEASLATEFKFDALLAYRRHTDPFDQFVDRQDTVVQDGRTVGAPTDHSL